MKLVYKHSGRPVEIGDRTDIHNVTNVVAHFSQPHKPDSEGKVTLTVPGSNSLGREYFVSVIGAEWIEREDRPASITTEHVYLAARSPYNQPGHVCPKTGRVAMTISDAAARIDTRDRTFYTYSIDLAKRAMDPWRRVACNMAVPSEGLSAATYVLDFANGGSAYDISPDLIVYMEQTSTEREAPAA